MSSKHTPGPWEMIPREQAIRTGDAYAKDGWASYVVGFDVWAADGERPIVGPNGIPALEADEANARLIAAAPDLLGALITAREAIASCDIGAFGWGDADGEPYPLKDELLAKFDAAIAKAGGAS